MDAWDVSFGVSIDAARCSGDYGAGAPMFAAKHIEKCCLAPKPGSEMHSTAHGVQCITMLCGSVSKPTSLAVLDSAMPTIGPPFATFHTSYRREGAMHHTHCSK